MMVAIRIMQSTPIVHCEGRDIKLAGHPSRLLRLLALNEGEIVSHEAISRLHGTNIDTTGSQARDLRDDLGDLKKLVKTYSGEGYGIEMKDCTVDAGAFRRAVVPIVSKPFDPMTDRIEASVARREADLLNDALKAWRGNPAQGLPSEEPFEMEFESLRKNAEERRLLAWLWTGQVHQIREAIGWLEHLVRKGLADLLHWRLLLLAHHANGGQTKVSDTIDEIMKFYAHRPVPSQLTPIMAGTTGRDKAFVNPFSIDDASHAGSIGVPVVATSPEDEDSILSVSRILGITTASQLRLANSEMSPVACIRRTRRRLWFSGVLASKWVIDSAVRSEFDKMLARLDVEEGDVRFLVINPDGQGYGRLQELRRGHVSSESIEPMRRLMGAHPSFKVRMFDGLPSFRTVIIDDDVVSFSPYRLAADAYVAAERGWDAPHVVLDPLAEYPLADAFHLLFEETWSAATPLEARS